MNFDFATAIETKIIGLDPISALNLFANHSGMAHFPLEGRTVVDPLLTPNLGCVNPRCRGSGCQDFNFLPDMGRMKGSWPLEGRDGCSPTPLPLCRPAPVLLPRRTCKANGIDPYHYFVWLFAKLPLVATAGDYAALMP